MRSSVLIRWINCLAVYGVLVVGSLRLFGYVSGVESVAKLGQLSAASPLPLVFSHFRGLETFSSQFWVVQNLRDGTRRELLITPEVYAHFGGSYNRRNVYGAVFAYGSKLTASEAERSMVKSVLRFGFCNRGPLLGMLPHKIADSSESISVLVVPKGVAHSDGLILPVDCRALEIR